MEAENGYNLEGFHFRNLNWETGHNKFVLGGHTTYLMNITDKILLTLKFELIHY